MRSLTSAQRSIRLKNEYEALSKLPMNSMYAWRPAPSESPPFVNKYHVIYYDTAPVAVYRTNTGSNRSLSGIKNQKKVMLEFTLGSDYPYTCPSCRIIEGKQPFLPNFFSSGGICFGHMYNPSLFLWDWFGRVGQLLLGSPEFTGYSGNELGEIPANETADIYYRTHRSLFPVRKVNSPVPGDRR